MNRYQIWVHDAQLVGHVFAESEAEAMDDAREREGHADLSVCEIDPGYYSRIEKASAGWVS